MSELVLVLIGLLVGVTTVLFGFGGGFVTVPVITVADAALGDDAVRVATATSALVMLVNAVVATLATRREVLARLRGRWALFLLLATGGALGAAAARLPPGDVIRWGFVLYVAATVVDLVARPGFLRPASVASRAARTHAMPTWLGVPIGGIASFLGVGGSVMTVPLMRRAGASMPVAAALANPLTLVTVAPALLVSLLLHGNAPDAPGLVGTVDVLPALALLAGSLPVIVGLRRRPPRIPDALHAWAYVTLLAAAGATVAVTG
ncbi:sulfite exporter TauE/SafE family protein [Streptomyces sp. NPDC050264]|uniref:sulfite exporter TauE/SafE family protein n=1 Tax=Streptomyces sp. NPDC050264 TaxID=3155038 RepID=UPI003418E680